VPDVLAIADDLTGALEVGAKFSGCGLPSAVAAPGSVPPEAPVVVIDTETRHLSGREAEQVVYERATYAARILYKKTDSTLRGNIAAELRALQRRYGPSRIAYVGAYPALGRTVRGGVLYVDGVPVSDTGFGRDPLNPVLDSRIRTVVDADCECVVFDGESDGDIDRAAQAILGDPQFRIVAGPAAIAGAIACRLSGAAPEPFWPRIDTCLIVNGSRHEVSRRQIEVALGSGCISAASGARWRLFVGEPGSGSGDPLEIARDTGRQVAAMREGYAGLMVFGGDTAFGILEALGCPVLRPSGEILPGVPVSTMDGHRQVLITKAGGFGDAGIIARLREALHGNNR
jgi:uncharacterized protein YgbK (DUF1537 family)